MLDLGCAVGATMIPFLKKDWEVAGVDPDESCVNIGKRELGLNLHVGEAESMKFDKGTFDFVLTLGTIEHCYNLEKAFLTIKNVLKPKGLFFMRYRSGEPWGSVLEYFNHNHYRYFTEKTLELLMARYGFEIVKFESQELEERPGDAYVLAKTLRRPALERVHKKISEGCRDDIFGRKKRLKKQQVRFVEKSKYLLKLAQDMNYDYALLAEEIQNGKHDLRLVSLPPIDAVKRAILEAEKVLENEVR